MRTSTLGGRGGSINGLKPPPLLSGTMILPDGFRPDGSWATLTASKYYYAPIYIENLETFSGVKLRDKGTANNGMKIKVAIFSMSDTTGALTGVAHDFGEVTLDAVEGIETLASAWTPPTVGWYMLAITSDSAADIYSMVRGL